MINTINKSNGSNHNPSTYGEVTQLGARQLFHYMKMYNYDCHDIHFIDLGSGNGKLVIQAYLEISNLKQVEGIELSSIRHNVAMQSWNDMKETAKVTRHKTIELSNCIHKNEIMDNYLPQEYDNYDEIGLNLIQGDLFAMDVSKATHIYVASLCFTDTMMNELSTKIINECDDKILRCVATLKPFSNDFEHRSGLMKDVKYVEMSWTKPRGMGGIVYFYSRKSSP